MTAPDATPAAAEPVPEPAMTAVRPAGPVRVAVVGLGWAGRRIWAPRLARHPGFEVVAAVDPDPAARADAAAAGLPVTGDLGVITPRTVDLAVVAVPNSAHVTIGEELLRRGVAVMLEKPVCLTLPEAALLAEAERLGGTTLLAGSAARYRGDVTALYDLRESLGSVRHLELAWVRAGGIPTGSGWFTRREHAGGGALLDLGWHLLDTAAPLLGGDEVEQVLGALSDDFLHDDSRRAGWRADAAAPAAMAGDVEDTVRGFLVTGRGKSIGLRASWASHEPVDRTTLRVEGSAGAAELRCTFGFSPDREPASLTVSRAGAVTRMALPEEAVGVEYDRQVDALPGLLADPRSRGRAVGEARRTIRVVEGLYDSARVATTRPARIA